MARQAGHDARPVTGADLGAVFVEVQESWWNWQLEPLAKGAVEDPAHTLIRLPFSRQFPGLTSAETTPRDPKGAPGRSNRRGSGWRSLTGPPMSWRGNASVDVCFRS
jgi:hypothetical protein